MFHQIAMRMQSFHATTAISPFLPSRDIFHNFLFFCPSPDVGDVTEHSTCFLSVCVHARLHFG